MFQKLSLPFGLKDWQGLWYNGLGSVGKEGFMVNEESTLENELKSTAPSTQHILGKDSEAGTVKKQIANMDYSDFMSLLRESRII